MDTGNLHVAIVGAGLGGLCLAQGLKKHGIAFDVYERDLSPSSRDQGYRIRIDQTGRSALAACLPPTLYALFEQTCAVSSAGVSTLNSQLETLTEKWVDAWRDDRSDDMPDLKANRLTMREVLLEGIGEHVHFGKHLMHYEEQVNGKIHSYYLDGSVAKSDVLIAADGINSRVRTLRFPDVLPVDTDNVCL